MSRSQDAQEAFALGVGADTVKLIEAAKRAHPEKSPMYWEGFSDGAHEISAAMVHLVLTGVIGLKR